jgi:hypothetical protein
MTEYGDVVEKYTIVLPSFLLASCIIQTTLHEGCKLAGTESQIIISTADRNK